MFLTLQQAARQHGIEAETADEIDHLLHFDYFVLDSYDFRSTAAFLPIKEGNRKTYLILERKTGFLDTNSDYLAMELCVIRGIGEDILTAQSFTDEQMRYLNALDYLYQKGLAVHSEFVLLQNEQLLQALKKKSLIKTETKKDVI